MTVSGKILLRKRAKAKQGELLLATLWLLKAVAKISFMRGVYRSLLIRLVKQTGLFDADQYLDVNNDLSPSVISPLSHYVAYGDREGRAPMPFFDPSYYRLQAPGRLKSVNSLLHYVYVGRYLKYSPSPWFDVSFYLAHNKDVDRAGIDPLLHYLQQGGLEGRSPCSQFDGAQYLQDNPDVVTARINPLLHYLRFGRYEGRQAPPVFSEPEDQTSAAPEIPRPPLPDEQSWHNLSPRAGGMQATVDVVVPVYKGRVETLRCLYSVLTATSTTPFELIVIDDASPDTDIVVDLHRLAGMGLFTLIVNSENCGFVQTVNKGMALHSDRDVLLLNSDTEVYDGWLDRLQQAAQRNDRTATVTPLSNNATICSYPRFLHDNPYPLELGYDELDALTAIENDGFEVEAPTAVGFCMYIKRACLHEIGLFDTARFGKGYGEENDFCQRAMKKGWRNVIAADVFVHHWGAASFLGEKAKRVQGALKMLDRLHPNYNLDVSNFIAADPLLVARRRLDHARLLRLRRQKNILIISHNRGGGSERHVQEDVQTLTRQGHGIFFLRPRADQPTHVVLAHPQAKPLPNLPSFALRDTELLLSVLKELGITEIHTHSLVDFLPEAPDYLISLVKSLGVRWEINLHDYKVICPRINLIDNNGCYCGEPISTACNSCLREHGSDFGSVDIDNWRAMHHRALLAADTVLVPDQDMAERLTRYFPEIRYVVSPHEQIDPKQIQIRLPSLVPDEKLRIVVIGAIGKIKGFDVLLACARDARQRRLPIEFIVMGYSMNDRVLQEAGVRTTGRYHEENALNLLLELSPHAVWLPSLWPETYSYTLSIAQQAGLPVFAFDIGAISRRIREYDADAADHLSPLEWINSPDKINARFVDFRSDRSVADKSSHLKIGKD